jgi:phosphoribosylanthranilate isomerase
VFVKICGITCAEDAVMACKYGANAIGINLYPRSKRHIPIDSATPWLQSMENRIQRVAVVVNPNAAELDSIRDSRCFDAIQFHGDESPEFCAAAGFPHWIKAFRVRKEDDMAILTAFPNARILIDAWAPGQYGGTGHRVDWKIARTLIDKNPGRQIILAGGLTPDNVAEAIRTTHPWGVDTAGGVEFEPGRKDEYLVREFIEQARSAWQAIP